MELGEEYVGLRYDSYFTGIEVNNIKQNREAAEAIIKTLPGKLILKEFPAGRATIPTLEAHITKLKDFDFEPDLILIDYVDLLSSTRKTKERKEEIDDIYMGTKGLAKQLNVPIWSVSQVNRLGYKDVIIEGDKAAGSYDKMMITDIAISLSRMKEDKEDKTGRFHIMKNRYGNDGISFDVKADTSNGHFTNLKRRTRKDDEVAPTSNINNNGEHFNIKKNKTFQDFFSSEPQ